MRLPHGPQGFVGLHGRDLQGVLDLRGVVAVVGVAPDAVGHAGQLEPPVRAHEVVKRVGDPGHVQPPDVAHADHREGVQHVALAGHADVEVAQLLAVQNGGEGREALFVVGQVLGPEHVVGAEAVGHGVALRVQANAPRAGIVAPGDAPAVLGHDGDVLREGFLDVVDVAVVVEMVLVDVQHDGHGGPELEEALPVLAGLHDEVPAVAGAGGAADEVQLPADVDGGVGPGGQERLGQHGGGGGLAVGAADADGEAVAGHQIADQVAALDLGNVKPGGLGALRVVRGDGGGVDHDVRAVDVLCGVADVDCDALLLEMVRLVGFRAVGARDLVAQLLQIARQARHGRSADADEVGVPALIVKDVRGHGNASVEQDILPSIINQNAPSCKRIRMPNGEGRLNITSSHSFITIRVQS